MSWAANVLETLTVFDEDKQPQPLLATEWELIDDGMGMNITLRDDVTFHTGRPMTAEDVKFSLERSALPELGVQVGYIARDFVSIDVVSPTELTIEFARPIPNIFDLFEAIFILDSETIDGLADGSEIVGTGPFRFESWSPGSELTLIRNDDYWGEKPLLDGIDIAIISDSTAMLNAVRSGRSQVAIAMSPVDIETLSSNPDYTLINTTQSAYPLGLRVTDAPFDSKEVRQAVNYAIDRERIADQVFGGAGVPTSLFWGTDTPGYPEDLASHFDYDPDKAEQMLSEAGASGAAVEITVLGLPQNTSVAEIVRNNLEAVGLAPTISVLDDKSFSAAQTAGDLGPAFMPLNGLNGRSPVTLIDTLPALREGNPSQFWTEEYEALRQDLLTALTDEESEQAMIALSEYLLDEAFSTPVVLATNRFVQANSASDIRWSARGFLDAASAFVTE